MWVTWFLNRGPTLGYNTLWEFTEKFEPRDGQLYWMAKHAHHVIHYEALNKNLNRVLRMVGLKEVKLTRRNVTQDKRPFMEYWDDYKLRNFFNNKYAAEFTLHGYKAR
jgi:hypothetical protein